MRPVLLAVLVFAAAPAGAVWGPSLGGQFFQPKEKGAERLLGWEAGLAAFGPEGQGFWHFSYGQARNASKAVKLASMAARLNFRLTGGKAVMLYAGGGIAHDRLENVVTRKAWVGSVQAGLLVHPGRLIETLKANQGYRNLANAGAPPAGPGSAKSLNIGLEGGYRMGPKGFGGLDARLFLLLTL